MELENPHPIEETLDPQDWQSLRRLGHRMVDDMFDYLQDVRQRPVWQPIPPGVKSELKKTAAGAATRGGDLSGFPGERPSLPAGEYPPALLGLGYRHGLGDWHAGRDAGGGDESQHVRRRADCGLC